VGLFFVKHFGVPTYRAFFIVRRYINKVLMPAKSRFVYIISNRYTVHVLMTLIVIGVTAVNLSARDVRAETFGQQSLLYQMVATDDSSVLEVVEAGAQTQTFGQNTSYVSGVTLDARRHIDINYLEESYVTPTTGDELTQPDKVKVPDRTDTQTYVVVSGDTIGFIAEKFGLSLSTVLWANNLTYNSTINLGQELKILPQDGVLYKVRSGDTLSSISRSYSVDTADIMEQNGLTSANRLSIGDELLLPDGEPPSPVNTSRSSASITTLFSAPKASAPSSSSSGWVWPTDWRVITQYYGWRHTGLDVDGDYSTYSYASRGGVVIYSGWRTGYGITVEVDHGDGFMTRYAHHSKNFVSVGDVVSTGQALAQTGTTGRSTGTHLHFEIIKGGRFLNPLDYIR
jgi:LysM repeat protein